MLPVYVLCNVNCVLPLIFPLFLTSFNRERSRKKLQNGTVIPGFSDLYRELSGTAISFALCAIQSAQKQRKRVYTFDEIGFKFLISYTNCAIL